MQCLVPFQIILSSKDGKTWGLPLLAAYDYSSNPNFGSVWTSLDQLKKEGMGILITSYIKSQQLWTRYFHVFQYIKFSDVGECLLSLDGLIAHFVIIEDARVAFCHTRSPGRNHTLRLIGCVRPLIALPWYWKIIMKGKYMNPKSTIHVVF